MRPELRWLVMTILIVGVLLAISALALDRPDVIWTAKGPECPACRTPAAFFAYKCKDCDTEFDWTVAPDAVSPISSHSLSRLEADALRVHIKRLGEENAAALVAARLEISGEEAAAYLEALGRGRCGYCGGTGDELGVDQADADCPVCFGAKNCIASGGTGHSTWGDSAAARADERLRQQIRALSPTLSIDVRGEELEGLARAFLIDHLGTVEAARLPYWRDLAGGLPGGVASSEGAEFRARRAADVARVRLDAVMKELRNAERP